MPLLKATAMAVAVLGLLFPGFCSGQPLTPAEALDRYLASRDQQPACSDSVFKVQIDASMPALRKQGSMSGLKLVSYTGQIVYRGLRFNGDKLVKTAVIARFLAHETNPAERTGDVAVSRQNYWFTYDRTSDYNGLTAYVFLLKPRRKRAGLFRGELWLTADTSCAFAIVGRSGKVTLHLHPQFPLSAGLPDSWRVLPAAPVAADGPYANCRHRRNGHMVASGGCSEITKRRSTAKCR